MIPFVPEGLAALKARYPVALEDLTDVEAVEIGTQMRPGERRRNVFDFPTGLRLIVSRDEGIGLHVSASLADGHPLHATLMNVARDAGPAEASNALRRAAERAYRDISGDDAPLEFVGFLEGKGIPHWRRRV